MDGRTQGLIRRGELTCSHDVREFERLAGVSPELPATLAAAC
jgi:hypothetical protein